VAGVFEGEVGLRRGIGDWERQDMQQDIGVLVILVVGVIYTAFTALVFSVLTLMLGKMFSSFEISGPDGWRFFDFYKRYLIIAAVYVFVALPLGNGLAGIGALAIAYKYVFDAGWVQAAVMGIVGGAIAFVLFSLLLFAILGPMGFIGR
jgi:hypothetical protein